MKSKNKSKNFIFLFQFILNILYNYYIGLSAADRLKEEMKYSNEINEKIKNLENKNKVKKTQNANKQANFEFQSEMGILKEKQ